jgi:UDP-glucose:(heptosyl)LPS alpha-1,3-glucosyltransferase
MHLALNFQRVDPSRGGAETYVADLCRQLILAGHRVDLYVESWADGCLPREVNVVPIAAKGRTKLDRIQSFGENSAAALSQAHHDCSVGFVNTWAHDVIIPQGGVHRGSLMANSQRFATTALQQVYRLAKSVNPKHWVYRAIESKQYDPSRPFRVVAVSRMVKRHIEEYHHVPSQQIDVVPNAIDPSRVHVSQPGAVRCAFRNKLGLEPRDLVGLFVGHNFALKGLKPLLAALAARRHQKRRSRPIQLLVCGGGDPEPYRRLAGWLGLADTVHFMGFYPEVNEVYHSSDFFVQPTYYDPCSLVVLEALACGLPVITTAQNGASELMTDGQEGYVLTSPDAQDELVAALDRMAVDATRRAMALEAARLGRNRTFDDHVAGLTAIFEEVGGSKKGRSPHSRKRGIASSSAPAARAKRSPR